MTRKKVISLLGLLLCLFAGLLLMPFTFVFPSRFSVEWLVGEALAAALAVVLVACAFLIYDERFMPGGIVAVSVGLVVLIYSRDMLSGVFALVGGTMALVAEGF